MGPSNIIARDRIGKSLVGLPLELFYEGASELWVTRQSGEPRPGAKAHQCRRTRVRDEIVGLCCPPYQERQRVSETVSRYHD
jgi:hypothetical protein